VQLYDVLLTNQHIYLTKIRIEVSSHIKVNTALVGFVFCRLGNWKVKWVAKCNCLTTPRTSVSAAVLQAFASFVRIVLSLVF